MISTKDKTPAEIKREKIKLLREFHQAILTQLGVPDAVFLPKVQYLPPGKTEMHISFFPSELKDEQDVYMELTNREYEPDSEKRTLYKWKFNPHYHEEYDQTPATGNTKDPRYLIPMVELLVVKEYSKDESSPFVDTVNFSLPDPETDLPMDQMTLRDYAAIHLNKPVSHKAWLNEIIKSK